MIHLSDQGSQYISLLFGERCSDADIEVAMGCTSAYDNAIAESFFASLAKDFLRRQLGSRDEARTAVFDYIETLYHPAPTSLNHRLSVVGRLREDERGGTTSRLITRCPPTGGTPWRGLELTYGWASRYLTARTWNPSDAGGGLEVVPTATTRAPWSATASRRCRYLKPEFTVNLKSCRQLCEPIAAGRAVLQSERNRRAARAGVR